MEQRNWQRNWRRSGAWSRGIGEGTVHGAEELAEELAKERCMEEELAKERYMEQRAGTLWPSGGPPSSLALFGHENEVTWLVLRFRFVPHLIDRAWPFACGPLPRPRTLFVLRAALSCGALAPVTLLRDSVRRAQPAPWSAPGGAAVLCSAAVPCVGAAI